jgi:hypothetical protein
MGFCNSWAGRSYNGQVCTSKLLFGQDKRHWASVLNIIFISLLNSGSGQTVGQFPTIAKPCSLAEIHTTFMQKNSIDDLRQKLFAETDGIKFSNLKDKLIKLYGESERKLTIEIFEQYIKEGKITHWREFLMTDLIDLILENESEYSNFFEWTVTTPKLSYWGIDGLIKTKGKNSYRKLVEIIVNESCQISIRAKAIKSISEFSRQPFDFGLPSDPGYWKKENFKIQEILEWQKNGYLDGLGYVKPKTHPSLKNPKTDLEKIVSKLEKKLEKSRNKNQDLANPSNWLVIADIESILQIEAKWTLPEKYLLFLKYFSPLRLHIDNKKFVNGLSLYGARNLIESQVGYSLNSNNKSQIANWPENFLVIGDDGGDPFCIDLGNISNGDSPIYTSMHGQGTWKFELFNDSFINFLKGLV